MQTSLT